MRGTEFWIEIPLAAFASALLEMGDGEMRCVHYSGYSYVGNRL